MLTTVSILNHLSPYSIIDYILYGVLFILPTYLFYNWKLYILISFTSFPYPLTLSPLGH